MDPPIFSIFWASGYAVDVASRPIGRRSPPASRRFSPLRSASGEMQVLPFFSGQVLWEMNLDVLVRFVSRVLVFWVTDPRMVKSKSPVPSSRRTSGSRTDPVGWAQRAPSRETAGAPS